MYIYIFIFSGVVVSLPESIVRDKYHHYNQLMANNFKTWHDGPNFDAKLPQNVTAIHGKSTQLVCRVIDLGNKTVRNILKYRQCVIKSTDNDGGRKYIFNFGQA